MLKFQNSLKYLKFAEQYIPLGSQTFSKSKLVFPEKSSPLFIKSAKGSKIYDIDNNAYIDLVSSLLPVILGYCDKNVDEAIKKQLKNGIIFSMPSTLEAKLAKILVDTIPSAEKVRFGKNGSDCASASIRLARSYTKKDHIICIGYHGWEDWYIGSTSRSKGVPSAVKKLTHPANYNNLESVNRILNKYKNNVAALIMEPANFVNHDKSYFRKLQKILKIHKTLLIFDEICTGFRFANGGAQQLFNVKPDLSVFGKSMANGMPISALVGKSKIMKHFNDVFFSTTFGGETLSIAAAIATINKIKSKGVVKNIWKKGEKLKKFVRLEIKKNNLQKLISIVGYDPWTNIKFISKSEKKNQLMKSFFIKNMIENKILINTSNNVSYSISNKDLLKIFKAYKDTFKKLSILLKNKKLNKVVGKNLSKNVFQIR